MVIFVCCIIDNKKIIPGKLYFNGNTVVFDPSLALIRLNDNYNKIIINRKDIIIIQSKQNVIDSFNTYVIDIISRIKLVNCTYSFSFCDNPANMYHHLSEFINSKNYKTSYW